MNAFKKGEYPVLPKWPGMVVAGKSVTEDQAAEIILRTNGFYFSSNDKAWEQEARDILGFPAGKPNMSQEERSAFHDAEDRRWEELGGINLTYLCNQDIMSAYIGGAHGWCQWDGGIGCCYGNIGKWPRVETVKEDWREIAKAFTYLDLRCQLYDKEMCEEGKVPIVQFRVKSGRVTVQEPKGVLSTGVWGAKIDVNDSLGLEEGWIGRERGCTADQLEKARDICLSKMKEEKV